jgi:hypothetical protein
MATPVHQSQAAVLPIWRTQPVVAGALAGIAGGVVFGLMMQIVMPQMMGMIGSLLGVPSLGWGVHLVFSAIFGGIFGLLLANRPLTLATALVFGATYGFVWWILGPLLIMPTWMGMGPQIAQALAGPNLLSLVGHLVYGVVTGAAFHAIRAGKAWQRRNRIVRPTR